jgi:multiple sugar transport system permease protein
MTSDAVERYRPSERVLQGVALVAILGVAMLPIYWMVLVSLRDSAAVLIWPPSLLPDFATFSLWAYVDVVTKSPVASWFANSVIIASVSTVLTVFIASTAGYALSRTQTRVGATMGYAILVSKMLPGTLLVLPFYIMFFRIGLLNTVYAPILGNVSFTVPFATWMMKNFFDGIPRELEEAAMIDGASPLRAFSTIILPLTLPGLAAVTLYSFILSWNDYIFAKTFLSGGDMTTIAVGATHFLTEVEMAWSKVMATAVIASLPVMVLFFLLERHFVAGTTQGVH